MLTFALGYLVQFFNFYVHLSLETVLPGHELNWHKSLQNWQFNHKLAPPVLHTFQAWKSVFTICQNMKVSGIQKLQFSNSLVNFDKLANIKKFQYFISFINWKKTEKSNKSNINKSQFSTLLWNREKFKVQLIEVHWFENPNIESKNGMKNSISQFEFHCWN